MDELFGLLGISSLVDPFRRRTDPETNSSLVVLDSDEIVDQNKLTSITADLRASIKEILNNDEQTKIVSAEVKKFVNWAKEFQNNFAHNFDLNVIDKLNIQNPMANSPEFKQFVINNFSQIDDAVKIFYVPKLMNTLLGFMGALPPKNSKIFHFNAFQSLLNNEDDFENLTKNPDILRYWTKLKIFEILSIITRNDKNPVLGWYYQDILAELQKRDQFFKRFSVQKFEKDVKPKSGLGKIQQYLFNMDGKLLSDFIEPKKTIKYQSNPILKQLLKIVSFEKPLVFKPTNDIYQKIEQVLTTRSIEYQLFKVFIPFVGADEYLSSIPYFFEGSTTFVGLFNSKNYFPIQTFYEIINKVDFPSPKFKKDLNEGKIPNVSNMIYQDVWSDKDVKQANFESLVTEFLKDLRMLLLKGHTDINLPTQILNLDPDLQVVAYENGALLKEWFYLELFVDSEKQYRGVIERLTGIVNQVGKFIKGLFGKTGPSIDGNQYVHIFPPQFQNTDIFQPYLKQKFQLKESYLPNVDIDSLPPMFLKPNILYEKENMFLPLAVAFDSLLPVDEPILVVPSDLWWFDNRASRRILQFKETSENTENKYRKLETQIRFPESIENDELTSTDFVSDEFSEWVQIMFQKRPKNRQCLNLLYDRYILSKALGKSKKDGEQFLKTNDASPFVISLFNNTVDVITDNEKFDLSFHPECITPSLPEPVITVAPVVFVQASPLEIEPSEPSEPSELSEPPTTITPKDKDIEQPVLQPTPQLPPQPIPPQPTFQTTSFAPSFSSPFTASGLMHQKRRKRSKPRINRSNRRRSPPRNRQRRRRSPRRSSRKRS